MGRHTNYAGVFEDRNGSGAVWPRDAVVGVGAFPRRPRAGSIDHPLSYTVRLFLIGST
jgi:hypothetical protein